MIGLSRGILVEYALALPPLVLVFELNPEQISRNRTVRVQTGRAPGTRSGWDFASPTETARASAGVAAEPESLSVTILLDGTDRMNDGELVASQFGIQPELDTLRQMVEPKTQLPGGLQILASLGDGGGRAFQRDTVPSVLIFAYGLHVLPVFLTGIEITEQAYLPSFVPYRAEARLTMQVIESRNPFYMAETLRQTVGAGLNTTRTAVGLVGGLL
jgi:hypothetical protein